MIYSDEVPTIEMTSAELVALPEYSCSSPTGVRIGKRWRHNTNAFRPPVRATICGVDFVVPWPAEWWLCEYAESKKPGYVDIKSARVRIVDAESCA